MTFNEIITRKVGQKKKRRHSKETGKEGSVKPRGRKEKNSQVWREGEDRLRKESTYKEKGRCRGKVKGKVKNREKE